MLPGTLAGQYAPAQMEVALAPLAQAAGAALVAGNACGLDLERRTVQFENHPPVPYDVLSVGVGSMPAGWLHYQHPAVVPIKPMQTFVDRIDQRIQAVNGAVERAKPIRIVIVGGGVAGIEVALCLQARLATHLPERQFSFTLATASDSLASGMRTASVAKLQRILADRQVKVRSHFEVTAVQESYLESRDGQRIASDCAIWATHASAPPVLQKLRLPLAEDGFLAIDPTLQTTAGHPIFAVGDCGTIVQQPHPKAGVFAVRQCPILWHNLHAILEDRPLRKYHAQRDFMKILNTGEGKALLEYKRFSFHAHWCWLLKSWIDRGFIKRYQ